MLTRDLEEALREFAMEPPPPPRSVLLVDDEPENLEVLAALLEDEFLIHVAADAASALEVLGRGIPIDLVVADQRMPGMSGVELLTRIAQRWPDTIRIVLTAYDDLVPMLDAINRGSAFRFLVKPCAPIDLRLAIREGLEAKASSAMLRHLVGALAARQDDLDRVVRDLRRTRNQLLATERLTTMGRAASGIVHNVRNLAAVVAFLVAEIQSSMVGPGAVAAGRTALADLEALVALLENVRAFARDNDARVELAPTDLETFLRQTVAVALLDHSTRPRSVDLDVSADVRSFCLDRSRVRHAVGALLSNALRASPEGAPITIRARSCVPIRADASVARRWLCIEVEDRGDGMDAATLARAGEPLFSRFDPPGLGLGIATARLAAAVHGGELSLESLPGEGTRARLVIPDGVGSSVPPHSSSAPPMIPVEPDAAAPILGFVASGRAPLRLLVTAEAAPLLEPSLALNPTLAAAAVALETGNEVPSGPAILVVTAREMRGPHAAWLRTVAGAASPGRPVVLGGADDRRILLEAINEWRAHGLLARDAPVAAVSEAVRRAYEALKVDVAVEICARELLTQCRKLEQTVAELVATQERLLHAERLATVGRVVGALTHRMEDHSGQLAAFRAALGAEDPAPRPGLRDRRADLLAALVDVHLGFNSLLADMLALAQDRSPELAQAAESLDELVERTVRVFKYDPLGRARDIRVAADSSVKVRVDGSRLRHALLNLLRNAAEATNSGALVQVRTARVGGVAVVEVEDEGEGMSAETMERIFTPFFTTKGGAGMGLGLRLSRAAVESHGGTLDCESEPGRGATFRIRLPVFD